MSDKRIIALLVSAAFVPAFGWNIFRGLRDGEVFIREEFGRVAFHFTREDDPIRFSLVLACNLCVILGVAAFDFWAVPRA